MTSIETSLGASFESDPARVGAYGVQARLSAGDTGPVYLARREDGTRVVVKVVASELAREPGFLDRLESELNSVRRAAPFGLARIVEIATRATPPHVVVEYVDGPTLDVMVASSGPFSAGDAYRLAVGLATALASLHSVPVVFGGLKPSNVVMSERGLRLLDFGTTRAALVSSSERRHATRSVLGTPAFVAPEQLLGRPAGAAADVFAWGAVVLFAATGRLPFGDCPTRVAVQRAVYAEPDLGDLALPLRTLVRLAMRKDPGSRLTAAELVLALVGAAGAPTQAPGRVPPLVAIPRQARSDVASASLARFPAALERVGDDAEPGEIPVGEIPLGEIPLGEIPAGEIPADAVLADEVPIDAVLADEVPPDEVPAADALTDESSSDADDPHGTAATEPATAGVPEQLGSPQKVFVRAVVAFVALAAVARPRRRRFLNGSPVVAGGVRNGRAWRSQPTPHAASRPPPARPR